MGDEAGWPRVSYADGLGSLQIASVRDLYRDGRLDPVGLARLVAARAEQQLDANVWTLLRPEAELVDAAADLSRRWPDPADRPPLYGVPVGVKDNVDVAGLATTAACPDFAYTPGRSARIVELLVDAGALIVGKTNLDQFATGLNGTRSPYGACRSPFDSAFVSGGSSSGSALAVSLGLVSLAVGTDTAGSGRVPAAFTNTVGVKPSRGLVSGRGVVPACRSLDCASLFALSVADATLGLSVIAGYDDEDPWSLRHQPVPVAPAQPAEGTRVGVPLPGQREFYGDLAGAQVFAAALERLERLGAELVPVDIGPFLEAGRLLYDGPWVAERLTHLEEFLAASPESILPVTKEILLRATGLSAADAFRGQHALARLRRETEAVWAGIDVLAVPTVPAPCSVADIAADPIGANGRLGHYTTFANLLDLAAIAVPAGFAGGLPYGVSLLGLAGADGELAALAAALHATAGLPVGATAHPLGKPLELAEVAG